MYLDVLAADMFGIRDGDKLPPLDGWLDVERALNLACRVFGAPGEWSDGEDGFLLTPPAPTKSAHRRVNEQTFSWPI
jgi:hypothetical protein